VVMNRDDLEMLVRAHQAELFRYLRYLGAMDHTLAEDLVQETFLAAFRSPDPPPVGEIRRQSAWLRGIARNLFFAHCRRSRTSPVHVDSAYLEQAEAVWATEFLREADGFDYMEGLRHCLKRLAEKERHLLDLRYAQEKSRAKMAHLLAMTEDGIKSALRRIRASLADCIEQRLALERGGNP